MAFKMKSGSPFQRNFGNGSPVKQWWNPWSEKSKAKRMQRKLDEHDKNIEEERIAQQETDDLELDRKWEESLSQMSPEELEAARTNPDLLPEQPRTDAAIAEEQRIADIKAKYAKLKASREAV